MTKKLFGVIGLGSIGMRHAKNLIKLGHDVIGYDPNGVRMIELVKAGGKGATYDEIIDSKAISGVVIASPTPDHAQHIIDNFRPDCGVFVEKPIANQMDEGIGYVDMVGYNLRFHSSVIKVKAMLDEGAIGFPRWASFICSQKNSKPAYLRDGVILNWSHEIDLAMYLFGPATVVGSSTRITDGSDDMTDILLLHANGCRSSVHLDYIGDPEIRRFTIMGDTGSIFANLITPRFITHHPAGKAIVPIDYGTDSFDDNYVSVMQEFALICGGKEPYRGCTGAEAMDVLAVCLEARKQAGLP